MSVRFLLCFVKLSHVCVLNLRIYITYPILGNVTPDLQFYMLQCSLCIGFHAYDFMFGFGENFQSLPCWVWGTWTGLQPSWECHGKNNIIIMISLLWPVCNHSTDEKQSCSNAKFPIFFCSLVVCSEWISQHFALQKWLTREIKTNLFIVKKKSVNILKLIWLDNFLIFFGYFSPMFLT